MFLSNVKYLVKLIIKILTALLIFGKPHLCLKRYKFKSWRVLTLGFFCWLNFACTEHGGFFLVFQYGFIVYPFPLGISGGWDVIDELYA